MSSYVNLNEGTSWTQTRMISNLRLGLSQHDILPQTNEPPSSYTLTKPLVDFKSPVNLIYSSIFAFVQLIHWLYFFVQKKGSAILTDKESSQKASHQNPSKHSPRIKWHGSGQTKSAPQLWWKKSGQPVDMENIRLFHFCIGVHMQQVVQDFLCKGWKSKVAHWSTWSICGDVLVTPTLVSPVASVCLTQTWITCRKVTCVPPIGGFR